MSLENNLNTAKNLVNIAQAPAIQEIDLDTLGSLVLERGAEIAGDWKIKGFDISAMIAGASAANDNWFAQVA